MHGERLRPRTPPGLEERLRRIEDSQIRLMTKLDAIQTSLLREQSEQREFRNRMIWGGLVIVGLMALERLGIDVSAAR